MSNEEVIRAAYYLSVSTESQELDNQRREITPFIERRGWKLVHPFEDVMTGRKTEKDRPGFGAMLKAAHQRKFRHRRLLGFGPADQGRYKSDAELSAAA
jgi:DNA invertase Pin-like site-specific DNA recombinase